MDTTRISIARVLALDVPLTWQDAVAVAQEAAMLSDVHAAMNSRPSLVSPETCFITRTGDLELPVTTEVESPDAVTVLLREMLAGRDAPEALEALAFGHATRDMSGALQQFPIASRRAEIAKLATRALALQARPTEAPAVVSTPIPAAIDIPLPSYREIPAGQTAAPVPPPAPPLVLPFVVPGSAPSTTSRGPAAAAPTFVRDAPFRASVSPRAAAPSAPAPAYAPGSAPEAELRRLRTRTVEREKARRRLSRRMSLAFGRFSRVITWRPSSPDPRILGAAVVVTAAVVSVVWTDDRPAASDAPGVAEPAINGATDPAAAPAATRPATSAPPPAFPTVSPPAGAAGTPSSASAAPATPGAAARRSGAVADARPAAAAGDEVPPAGASGERGTAPRAGARGGVTITVPALDPAPGPLAGNTGVEPRPTVPGTAMTDGIRDGRAPVYSATDADVAPPVMLRQQLPSTFIEPAPDAPDDWPYLELLIDRRGAVEQVRLHAKQPAPGQTLYRHRMLLAAAKAWQFEPARRHGTPVRYVMRVPLEP